MNKTNRKNKRNRNTRKIKGGIDYSIVNNDFSKIKRHRWNPTEENLEDPSRDFEKQIRKINTKGIQSHVWNPEKEFLDDFDKIISKVHTKGLKNYVWNTEDDLYNVNKLREMRKKAKEKINQIKEEISDLKNDRIKTRILMNQGKIEQLQDEYEKQNDMFKKIERDIRIFENIKTNLKKNTKNE
jgi:hypothetical protein